MSQDINEINHFFKTHKKIILKPIHGYGSNAIHLLKKLDLNFIKKFIKKHDHIMCQKFLPKINKGDKRVFLINGKICGAISRVPKQGSFLSNMSKGATPINTKLSNIEKKISNIIAKDLKNEKIFFIIFNQKNKSVKDIELLAKAINSSKLFFKKKLSKNSNLRSVPNLRFIYDNTESKAFDLEELINKSLN